MDIRIDNEFRAYIPPLSAEERDQLEANIVAKGCLDPLVVWRGILVDGHNRFEICTRRGIRFDVAELFFDHREEALDWMDAHQLGRRNLSPDARRLLLGRRYNRLKGERGGDRRGEGSKYQNDTSVGDAAAKLASEHGVSAITVKRAGKFAEDIDADADLKAAVAAGVPVAQVRAKVVPADAERMIESRANDDEPAAADTPVMSADEAKQRRKLARMPDEAKIDEIIGLRASFAEMEARLRATASERDKLKEHIKDFTSDKDESIRRLNKKAEWAANQRWRAEQDTNHFKGKCAVLERKLAATEKRLRELGVGSAEVAA